MRQALIALLGFCWLASASALEPALEFDGTNDAATCGTGVSALSMSANWSLAFIANVNNFDEPNISYIVNSSRDTTLDGHQLWIRNRVANDEVELRNNSNAFTGTALETDTNVTAGAYFIYVLRNTGSGTSLRFQVFTIAGTEVVDLTSTGWDGDVPAAVRFTLGNIWIDGSSWFSTGYFDGQISHVMVLDGETLSDGDMDAWVADPVNTGALWVTTKSSALKLWLQDASDISGGAIQDYSPAGNDCTVVGETTFTASGPDIPPLVSTAVGNPFNQPFRGPFGGPL